MKNLFILLFSVLLGTMANAQNNVGINNPSPDASAALDVTSTSQGMLVPRMSKNLRDLIASPATGLLIWQVDNVPGFYFNSGTAAAPSWVLLGAKGDTGLQGSPGLQGVPGPAGSIGLTGPAGTNGQGIPAAGTAGQVLTKVNGTDYNTQWVTPTAVAPTVTKMPNAFYGHATSSINPNFCSPFQPGNTTIPQAVTSFLIPVACTFTITFSSYEDETLTFEIFGVTAVANNVSYATSGSALASCVTTGWASGAAVSSSLTYTATQGQLLTIKTSKPGTAGVANSSGGFFTAFSVN